MIANKAIQKIRRGFRDEVVTIVFTFVTLISYFFDLGRLTFGLALVFATAFFLTLTAAFGFGALFIFGFGSGFTFSAGFDLDEISGGLTPFIGLPDFVGATVAIRAALLDIRDAMAADGGFFKSGILTNFLAAAISGLGFFFL
jgi:cellulose synthase/poly-beta-1,6-N-acetylglucosamine synthase-like glycosyltransferase